MKISDIVAKLTGLEARVSATDKAELLALKQTVEGQLTQLTGDLATAKQTIETVSAENQALKADKALLETNLSTATATSTSLNSELTAACVAVDCLELGLKPEATAEEKQAAALAVAAPDKIKALSGAVTTALQKTGVTISKLPKPGATASAPAGNAREQYDSITDPVEKVKFYRANKSAVDESFRKQTSSN